MISDNSFQDYMHAMIRAVSAARMMCIPGTLDLLEVLPAEQSTIFKVAMHYDIKRSNAKTGSERRELRRAYRHWERTGKVSRHLYCRYDDYNPYLSPHPYDARGARHWKDLVDYDWDAPPTPAQVAHMEGLVDMIQLMHKVGEQ